MLSFARFIITSNKSFYDNCEDKSSAKQKGAKRKAEGSPLCWQLWPSDSLGMGPGARQGVRHVGAPEDALSGARRGDHNSQAPARDWPRPRDRAASAAIPAAAGGTWSPETRASRRGPGARPPSLLTMAVSPGVAERSGRGVGAGAGSQEQPTSGIPRCPPPLDEGW